MQQKRPDVGREKKTNKLPNDALDELEPE